MLDLKDKGTESKNKNKPIYVASQLPQSWQSLHSYHLYFIKEYSIFSSPRFCLLELTVVTFNYFCHRKYSFNKRKRTAYCEFQYCCLSIMAVSEYYKSNSMIWWSQISRVNSPNFLPSSFRVVLHSTCFRWGRGPAVAVQGLASMTEKLFHGAGSHWWVIRELNLWWMQRFNC